MNKERIRKLKHQASLWCDENIPDQYSEETNGYGSAWEDKFAELIVQECLNQCYNRGMDDELYAGQLKAATYIEEYFGVEE